MASSSAKLEAQESALAKPSIVAISPTPSPSQSASSGHSGALNIVDSPLPEGSSKQATNSNSSPSTAKKACCEAAAAAGQPVCPTCYVTALLSAFKGQQQQQMLQIKPEVHHQLNLNLAGTMSPARLGANNGVEHSPAASNASSRTARPEESKVRPNVPPNMGQGTPHGALEMLSVLQQASPRWAAALKERLGADVGQHPGLQMPQMPKEDPSMLLAQQQQQQQADLILAQLQQQQQQQQHSSLFPLPPGLSAEHLKSIIPNAGANPLFFPPGGIGPMSPHGQPGLGPPPQPGHPGFPMGDPSVGVHHPFANPYGPYGAAFDLNGMRRKNATRETTAVLKQWLSEHRKNPYPTKGEKIMLAIISKMTLTQVSTWFANARRRLKKENKANWQGGHGTSGSNAGDDDDVDFGDDENGDEEILDNDNDDDEQPSIEDHHRQQNGDDDKPAEAHLLQLQAAQLLQQSQGGQDPETAKRLAAQMAALLAGHQQQQQQQVPQAATPQPGSNNMKNLIQAYGDRMAAVLQLQQIQLARQQQQAQGNPLIAVQRQDNESSPVPPKEAAPTASKPSSTKRPGIWSIAAEVSSSTSPGEGGENHAKHPRLASPAEPSKPAEPSQQAILEAIIASQRRPTPQMASPPHSELQNRLLAAQAALGQGAQPQLEQLAVLRRLVEQQQQHHQQQQQQTPCQSQLTAAMMMAANNPMAANALLSNLGTMQPPTNPLAGLASPGLLQQQHPLLAAAAAAAAQNNQAPN